MTSTTDIQSFLVSLVYVEKPILDHLNAWRASNPSYSLSEGEKKCMKSFEWAPFRVFFYNSVGWGMFTYMTLGRQKLPMWLNAFGAVGISSGLFASMYLTSKGEHRQCIQCILDGKDKKSEFYLQTRRILQQSHPDADDYFQREKYRLYAPQTPISPK